MLGSGKCSRFSPTARRFTVAVVILPVYNGSQLEFIYRNVDKPDWLILKEHYHIDRKICQLSIHLYVIVGKDILLFCHFSK